MSGTQMQLGEYGTVTEAGTGSGPEHDSSTPAEPLLGFDESEQPDRAFTTEIDSATAEWVVFTGRYPYVFDAARLGFAIGHREDASYQWQPDEISLPVHFLDNNFKDPSLGRFVDRVFELEPEVAVLGDIYDEESLSAHLDAADELWSSYPDMKLVLAPKCASAVRQIPSRFILGYANGASPVQATDVATHRIWRTQPNSIHILGGTPLSTLEEIKALTKPTVTDTPQADIAGIDWNGYQRYAENHGDYAAATGGWHRNLRENYPAKRDLIRASLVNAKHFWVLHGIWPDGNYESLPSRSELQTACDAELPESRPHEDVETLVTSPSPTAKRHTSPLYRTDETQAEVHEPLSPLATLFGNSNWAPDGSLNGATKYSHPAAHSTEPTCAGCGAHIWAEPFQTTGYRATTDDQLTVRLVSYERQRQDRTHSYESVPVDGPETLTVGERFPALHCFCSKACQQRAERQTPHLLVGTPSDERCHPAGETVATVSVELPSQ